MRGTMDYQNKLFQCNKELMDSNSEIEEQCGQNDDQHKEIIRSSMHWEEFFGSSLDLAPALLSIYDSIAAGTNGEVQYTLSKQDEIESNGNNNDKTEDRIVDRDGNDESVDNLCKMASSSSILNVDQDRKKRPLSISSMSSSSSSSLPRHTRKRPNLTQNDQAEDLGDKTNSGNFNDKLDQLLYIDDDAPSGITDEEMSVDTDGGSKSSAESNSNSFQIVSPSHSQDCLATPSHSAQTSFLVSQGPPDGEDDISQGSPEHLYRRDSTSPQKYVSYVHRVVTEIIDTERTYINNLRDILEGYFVFIKDSPDLKISDADVNSLFGNIGDIYHFGREFLQELEKCGDDPVKVAECFVRNIDRFKIYAQYCTNYPSAVEVLTMIMKDPHLSEVFKGQQLSLRHNLPLGAYLLKPVQRILKYHLLLQNILKNYDKTELGHETLTKAFDHMTSMAHHINEMKRKHEHAVRVQEIQSQLEDYQGEDLTRLGELVLEGSFRIYGAKSSRQVFLFERGVLIGKRKEDGMLICRVLIHCSNLMLVESIPREPLSFQVIPFDNPRGQHTLQARNLEQKRKWCQEIKRLIIESFKGKIPEKVKGLVMELGKSREEESGKLSTVERKIYHHNAPEYLERRQRMRRKSGTMLTDLLKPQRGKKGQRRAESCSPRSSPPPQRKILSQSPSTPDTRDLYEENNSSIDSTPQYESPAVSGVKPVGRSVSFRQAVKRQPLRSVDFSSIEDKENTSQTNSETPKSRRSRSFKRATKQNPMLSLSNNDLDTESTDSLNQESTKSSKQDVSSIVPVSSKQANSPKIINKYHGHQSNEHSGSLCRNGKYFSMPVLNVLEPPSPTINRNRKCSDDITRTDSGSSIKKRIFDTKLYFQRDKNENGIDLSNLRRGSNSVSAFNDSYKHSSENLVQKVGPIILTKPKPFVATLNVQRKKKDVQKSLSTGAESCQIINEDPWEPKSSLLTVSRNANRTHSVGEEDILVDRMDWLVYANRNSLPVDGFDLGPKLYKYCTPPRSSMDLAHAQMKHNESKGFNLLDNLQKCISNVSNSPTTVSRSDNCLDSGHKSDDQNEFPNFGALPVVKIAKSQPKLNRSNSNPQSRLEINKWAPRYSSTSVFDSHLVKDHEQIIAEMEDYMKRSESTSTVSSVKFPAPVGNSIVDNDDNKRDSCVSNISNSSYESSDTASSSPGADNFMGTLKNKIFDLKQKLTHRRSGSYDNRDSSDNEIDNDKSKSKETRSSLLSLFSHRTKENNSTDLQTVLHAGDWGSPSIGQRMAEQEPTYVEIGLSLTKNKEKPEKYKVDVNGQTKDQNLIPPENLQLQNCDSAFSIQSDMAYGSVLEDSPRSENCDDKSKQGREGSQSSNDSFYEKRLSFAFDEGEAFRDSAVYCEMDPDQAAVKSDINLSSRAPIKSYVQKLEEKTKPTQPCVTKVRQREPGAIIKQRLESLHTNCYKNSCRPTSVERELRFYSRPTSVERELSFPSRPSSEERQIRSVSVDVEFPSYTKTYSGSSGKTCLRREKSDFSHPTVHPYSGQITSAISTNRIDQLTADVHNLIVMRGWVRQLIDKFQSKK